MAKCSNKIGFWAVYSIVTGSQIGSGIFTLPACLAPYGFFGLIGCVLASLGAISLCFVFASFCAKLPYTGGPHVYVQHVFGKKLAFFTGWTYWVISWVSTTAVIVTSIGYLSPFLLRLLAGKSFCIAYTKEIHLLLELFLLALIALINLRGIKFAGYAETFLTLLRFIPLIVLPILALCYFNKNNFIVVAQSPNITNADLLGKVTLFALWGFIGLETATTPAGSVNKPSTTIPKAIIFGTLSVALLYILNFAGIMGLISGSKLMHSSAPYVDAAQLMFGGDWHLLVAIISSVVLIGTLNAWVLTSSQISLGLSIDGFMPKIFKFRNKMEAPSYGIIISCLGIVPLLILTSLTTDNLSQQAIKIIDVSLFSFLFVYLICVISFIKLLIKENNKSKINYLISCIALIFCLWVIYKTISVSTLLIASLFTFSGLPLYFFWYLKKNKHINK